MLEYRKVYDYITESWVWEPYETDPCRVEYSTPGEAKLKALGMYKGMKPKSWNELTPEEKALFEEKKPKILGAIVGDICGSIYEFNNVKTTNFELLDGRNRPTDDTIMTLAVADWLVEDPTHSSEFLVENMVTLGRNYIGCGFGGMFRRWLVSDKHTPYNSFGNGSAMRVSPVGLYAETLEEALDLAKRSAEVTHNHPEGIKGAQAVAAAMWMLKEDEPKYVVRDYLVNNFGYEFKLLDDIKKSGYKFDETCQGSVPVAIEAAFEGHDFEDTIKRAISVGGDSDTIAAIAGSVASCIYEIPDNLTDKCLSVMDNVQKEILDNFLNKI